MRLPIHARVDRDAHHESIDSSSHVRAGIAWFQLDFQGCWAAHDSSSIDDLSPAPSPPPHHSVKTSLAGLLGYLRSAVDSARSSLDLSFLPPFCDQAVTSAANVLVGVILARSCEKSEFGLYTLGLTIIMFGLNFQTAVIWTPYTVFVPRLPSRARALYAGSTLIHQLVSSAALVVGLGAFVLVFGSRFGDQRFGYLFFILCVTAGPYLFREYCRRVSFANLNFISALKLDTVVAVSQISLMLLFMQQFRLSATIVFLLVAFSSGIPAVVWIIVNKSIFSVRSGQILKDWIKNWAFGRWIFASSMLWSVQAYATPWVIAHTSGLEMAGAWAACIGAIAIGNPILLATQNYIGPTLSNSFAKHGTRQFSSQVIRFVLMIGIASVIFLLMFAFFGQDLISLMYGSAYGGLGLVLLLLAFNFSFSVVQVPFTSALLIFNRVRLDFAVNLVTLIVFSVSVLPSVRHFGLLGGAGVLALCSGTSVCIKAVSFLWISVHAGETGANS